MKEFVKVMKAVSNPARAKILKMLQRRVMCACEIQTALLIESLPDINREEIRRR